MNAPPPTSPITVAFVLGTLGFGGAEGQVLELMKGLPARGFRPVVILMEDPGGHSRRARALGIPVHVVDADMRYRKFDPRFLYHSCRTAWRMSRVLRREGAAVMHAYLYWASIFGVAAAIPARTPVRITSRRNMGFFKDGRAGYQAIENLANFFTHAVTSNSRRVHEDTLARERITPAKCSIIYNGVEIERFASAASRDFRREFPALADANPLVGVVANLKAHKAHADLVDALAVARRDAPKLKCVCVGFDKEGLLAGLLERARSAGVAEAIVFADGVGDAAATYKGLDMLCLPSHHEGFANVILEAMAAGLPVVATDAGGNAEAVIDGETGIIVPRGRPELLGRALARVADDATLRREMGAAGQRRARGVFSLDRMIDDTAALYRRLLAEGG